MLHTFTLYCSITYDLSKATLWPITNLALSLLLWPFKVVSKGIRSSCWTPCDQWNLSVTRYPEHHEYLKTSNGNVYTVKPLYTGIPSIPNITFEPNSTFSFINNPSPAEPPSSRKFWLALRWNGLEGFQCMIKREQYSLQLYNVFHWLTSGQLHHWHLDSKITCFKLELVSLLLSWSNAHKHVTFAKKSKFESLYCFTKFGCWKYNAI